MTKAKRLAQKFRYGGIVDWPGCHSRLRWLRPKRWLIGEKPEPNTVLYAPVDCGESSASVAASQASKAVLECAQKHEVPELGKTTYQRPKKYKGTLLKVLLSEPAPNGELSPTQNSNSTTAVVVRGHDNSAVDILNARFV